MENYIEQIIHRDFFLGSVVQVLQTILLILKSRTKEVIVYMAHNLALSDVTLKEHRLLTSLCDCIPRQVTVRFNVKREKILGNEMQES